MITSAQPNLLPGLPPPPDIQPLVLDVREPGNCKPPVCAGDGFELRAIPMGEKSRPPGELPAPAPLPACATTACAPERGGLSGATRV